MASIECTPQMASHNHRLLYRGALELPDSYMVLDGLSFTLSLGAKDGRPKSSPSMDLLQNPLALALESMRGRPSLQFLGTTRVEDVFVDSSCHANVFIHPDSMLTRTCFQNMFCLSLIMSADGRTEYGIRVGLGDQDAPGSSEILIYGQSSSDLSSSESRNPSCDLQILATRIVPAPPPSIRLPRPDDPTPRQPPLVVFGEKRGRVKKKDQEDTVKLAKDVMRNMPKAGAISTKGPRVAGSKSSFKVPEVPQRSGDVGDVFESNGTSKSKSRIEETDGNPEDLDKRNRAEVKKTAVRFLAKYGVNKEHQSWKDLFGFVYRGASFALRLHMNSKFLDSHIIDEFVEMHVRLYLRGDGILVKPQ